jgi:hypothetical protein
LGADALVFGHVSPAQVRFDVTTFVGDSYEVFVPPAPFVNRKVDLNTPEAAALDSKTHAAILTAIAAGYESKKKYSECVEVTVAAEQLTQNLSPELRKIRERCQRAVGTDALRREGTQ